MNKFYVITIVLFFSMMASVLAAEDKNNNEANMTFGQCVAESAFDKNDCYASIKQKSLECKTAAGNDSAAIDLCKSTYKTDKKECKADFKAAKQECKKIKHNFLEGMGIGLGKDKAKVKAEREDASGQVYRRAILR